MANMCAIAFTFDLLPEKDLGASLQTPNLNIDG